MLTFKSFQTRLICFLIQTALSTSYCFGALSSPDILRIAKTFEQEGKLSDEDRSNLENLNFENIQLRIKAANIDEFSKKEIQRLIINFLSEYDRVIHSGILREGAIATLTQEWTLVEKYNDARYLFLQIRDGNKEYLDELNAIEHAQDKDQESKEESIQELNQYYDLFLLDTLGALNIAQKLARMWYGHGELQTSMTSINEYQCKQICTRERLGRYLRAFGDCMLIIELRENSKPKTDTSASGQEQITYINAGEYIEALRNAPGYQIHALLENFILHFPCPISGDGHMPTSAEFTQLYLDLQDGLQTLLLNKLVDVDARNEALQTPLMVATNLGLAEIVKILLDHGADPFARINFADRVNEFGHTALDHYLMKSNIVSGGSLCYPMIYRAQLKMISITLSPEGLLSLFNNPDECAKLLCSAMINDFGKK